MIVPGIIFLLLLFSALYLFWNGLHRDAYTQSLVVLMLLSVSLKCYASYDRFLHCWDERYHALVAKNLMHHPLQPLLYRNPVLPYDFTNWTINHVWLHKQPLTLWCMAISMKLFGVSEWAIRIPSILCSTLGIVLVYRICASIFDRKAALFSSFLFAVNGLIIELASGRAATDHPDIFFLFFILLGIWSSVRFAERGRFIWAISGGLATGAALLCKWFPGLIVLPVSLVLIRNNRQFSNRQVIAYGTVLCSVAAVVFLPWQIYIQRYFPAEADWERQYNLRHFLAALEGQGAPWYYFIDRIRIDYGELVYIPIVWIIYQYYNSPRNNHFLALIFWFAIPLVFFSLAATKMQAYMLIASPALFMVTGAWYAKIDAWHPPEKYKWLRFGLLLALFLLPVRYCVERIKPFSRESRQPRWVTDLKGWDQKENSNALLFGYAAPIEAMFYTNATVYAALPPKIVLDSLSGAGYDVFVYDKGDLSDSLQRDDALQFVSFAAPPY